MEKQEVIEYINRQDSNIVFFKNKIEELENHIKQLQKGFDINWINPDNISLIKKDFSANEITTAFMQAKVYEGLKTNEFTTVLDTFIHFLNKTHHSLNKNK